MKKAYIGIFIALILCSSWLFPPTRALWNILDESCFYFLNGSLAGNPQWQYFWGFANGHLMDWIHDVVFFLFFLIYIFKAPSGEKQKRAAEIFLFILITAFTVAFVNKFLLGSLFSVMRKSPTLVLDHVFFLSEHVPLLHVKDRSYLSFPGDHATTAALFVGYLSILGGWRFGVPALLYGIFFCLPRLISGAHWLTDNLIGSASIALVILSLTFACPYFRVLRDRLARIMQREKSQNAL